MRSSLDMSVRARLREGPDSESEKAGEGERAVVVVEEGMMSMEGDQKNGGEFE